MKINKRKSSNEVISEIGQGVRVVNVKKIKEYTDKVAKHGTNCDGSIVLNNIRRNIFHRSVFYLSAYCITGQFRESKRPKILPRLTRASPLAPFSSQKILPTSLRSILKLKNTFKCRYACNLAAVWGKMFACGGHSNLERTLSVMGTWCDKELH